MDLAGLEKHIEDFAGRIFGADPNGPRHVKVVSALAENVTGVPGENCNPRKASGRAFVPSDRICGNDWPCTGMTMIGIVRLMNVAKLLKSVVDDSVPGAFAELGVWRGGTCISSELLFVELS